MKTLPLFVPFALGASLYAPALAADNAISNTIGNDISQTQTASAPLPAVVVKGKSPSKAPYQMRGDNDAAQLLGNQPGYSVASGGGVSGLPIVNGLGDDRLKIRIDGMEITSACGNHMNAPLSYVDPKQIAAISLMPGATPVSLGGDNIGGTIEVQTAAPVFADDETLYKAAGISLTGRSASHSLSMGVNATIATESLSLSYSGTRARAESYRDGDGNKVPDTLYKSTNQTLLLAWRGQGQQLALRIGEQRIPYQGFPNQYMDMTDNHGRFGNLAYAGEFAWGKLDGKLYWQDTEHAMGFFSAERRGMMPMNTEGRNTGYALQAEMPLGAENGVLRLGHEYHAFGLHDFWPAVPGSMMMGPQTYLNINHGKRDRLAFFAEWEKKFDSRWTAQFGLRDEIVKMDTGNVQSYGVGMMNAADARAAEAFNRRDRARRDNNLDFTALASFAADASQSYTLALAQKTRSPNLYERYTWGRGTMAMTMTNWAGDGNGYVGNPDLKPETAYTLSASADWHGAGKEWQARVTPYFTYVKDYIDADVIGRFNPYMIMSAQGNLLQFANHDARLYGLNFSWNLPLLKNAAWGQIDFKGHASVTRGARIDGGNLYHIMPFNAQLVLEQLTGRWTNTFETALVKRKSLVDANRLEPQTSGYALLNLRTVYQLAKNAKLSAGVANLLDKRYDLPLGGVNLPVLANTGSGPLQSLHGEGRSFELGLALNF